MCEPCVCAASSCRHVVYAHCSVACANSKVFCLCAECFVCVCVCVCVCVRQNTKRRIQTVLRERWASFPQAGKTGDDTSAIPTPPLSSRFLPS